MNAVTNLSVKNAFPLEQDLFDVLIIDEASQCDVASALPLIQRAKQIVVIGDPLQLRHISSINIDEETAIREAMNISDNPLLKYSEMSLYDYCQTLLYSAANNNRRVVLEGLYRWYHNIIGYSNKFFHERKFDSKCTIISK